MSKKLSKVMQVDCPHCELQYDVLVDYDIDEGRAYIIGHEPIICTEAGPNDEGCGKEFPDGSPYEALIKSWEESLTDDHRPPTKEEERETLGDIKYHEWRDSQV